MVRWPKENSLQAEKVPTHKNSMTKFKVSNIPENLMFQYASLHHTPSVYVHNLGNVVFEEETSMWNDEVRMIKVPNQHQMV